MSVPIDSESDELEWSFTQRLSTPGSSFSPEFYVASLAVFYMAKYLKDNLQYIFKTVLETRTSMALIVSS